MDPVSRAREQVGSDLRQGGVLDQQLPGYEERLSQIEMAEAVATSLTNGKHTLIEAGTGTGKALDIATPIPTPTGWKRMDDLVVGDEVFDENGQPTRVTAAFDVMHDHSCYEVVFSDGSSLIADAEHEWVSYTHNDRKWAGRPHIGREVAKKFVTPDKLTLLDELIALSQHGDTLTKQEAVALIGGHHWSVNQTAGAMTPMRVHKTVNYYDRQQLFLTIRTRLAKDWILQHRDGHEYSVVTTEAMAATLRIAPNKRLNHAIKVAQALVLPESDVPIDPYFLGVWLGDESSRNNQITSADPDMLPEIEKAGYSVRKLSSHHYLYAVDDENGKARSRWQPGMTGRLRALNVLQNKHIPPIYLRASREQRLAILAGLLDTDGTVSRHGAIEFTTTIPQLEQDVHELVCSLGFRPYVLSGRARLNGKDCGPKWTIAFTTNQRVFRLPRKILAHQERLRNFTPERNCFRYVADVREVPSRPVRCIQVDAPSHLYLAGRSMIPTHNSLAYLLPIVRSGRVALIATANKALQEQLFYKDIPFITEHVQPVKAALVKGMSNYLCLKHLADVHTEQDAEASALFRTVQVPALDHLDDLLDNEAFDGDLDVLSFPLSSDLRRRVAADSDDCAWQHCPFFGGCYVRKMRNVAQNSQIVVINHTLLLIDVLMEGWLLPDRDVIVIDEAHHLEEEATRAFTVTVSPRRVEQILRQKRLREHCDPVKLENALNASVMAWGLLADTVRLGNRGRAPVVEAFEPGLRLGTAIAEVGNSLRQKRPEMMAEQEEQLYDKLTRKVAALAADLRMVFAVNDPEGRVYYVEREFSRRGREETYSVSAAPLFVTELLKEKLFDRVSVIATSATIAINGKFDYFRKRVGVGDAVEMVLPLAFDYHANALLYVPRLKHEPAFGKDNAPYFTELAEQMGMLVRASRGRAFLLFTSNNALRGVLDRMEDGLVNEGFDVLVQGTEIGRAELLRRFRTGDKAVLFGLRSFWEGVDVAGDALSLVAIDKLPFDPPDDPVHEARVKRMREAGENWFGEYVLPQAILRLKQGVGRLLRTHEDRGVLAILDTRLLTKGYGRQVIFALPPARRTTRIEEVQRFFSGVEVEEGHLT